RHRTATGAEYPAKMTERRLRFRGAAATGVRFDCDGGRIDAGVGSYHEDRDIVLVESQLVAVSDAGSSSYWRRPEDVTISDCYITGGVRILGVGGNGEALEVRRSSLDAEHVKRLRERAPTRITLERVVLTAVGRSPLYIAPGVTDSVLIDSEIRGHTRRAAIYLDAETARNRIENNLFDIDTEDGKIVGFNDRGWPQIAIDASSHNIIINNVFRDIENGGVYLYRNCGLGGTIRHSTPSWNRIINNVFILAPGADNPAIYIGSRDYDSWYENGHGLPGWTRVGWIVPAVGAVLEGIDYGLAKLHCDEDEYSGSPYGSGRSNSDHARFNAIMQNQFVSSSWSRSIRSRDWSDNEPNFFADNRLVEATFIDADRPAGCFIPALGNTLLRDGQTRGIIGGDGCYEDVTCRNGEAVRSGTRHCRVREQAFGCRVVGDNRGCTGRVRCRSGERLVAAKAACNLEYGRVSDAYLDATQSHRLRVERASDKPEEGTCFLAGASVSELQDVIDPVDGRASVGFGCSEHDKNGGDCDIRGAAYCLAEPTVVMPPRWTMSGRW
ncbi:MAG: right-handed parallel beta-helix repeat-containing protein, partial [Gammaproteobacteria bacterium]|nr:right-handed parallel beta-helix repeat-containing protein [Gammaproteobacteria bacterium]